MHAHHAGLLAHACDAERPSRLDVFDPRCRIVCALCLAAALASVRSFAGLATGIVIPLILLAVDEFKPLARTLIHLNGVSVFVCILLPLTFPGERVWGIFSTDGLRMALLVTAKLNLISVVLIRMVAALGMGRIDNVLGDFHIPEKMRVLLLLTMRYVLLLAERVATMTRAIFLRAPDLRGKRMCHTFACMLGTTLIHSSDRAERSMLAMQCRGGMKGFLQCCPLQWSRVDTLLCAFFALNVAAMAAASFYF